jgi:branched-chain amino acid transport system permease protein
MNMSGWIEIMIGGLLLGMLYALFGLGLSLGFGVMKLINLAHGDLMVLAALMSAVLAGVAGFNPFASLLVVVPIMAVVGYIAQRLLLNRVIGTGPLPPLLVTFGLSIILQNAMQEIFTADTRSLQVGAITSDAIVLGNVSIGTFPLLVALVSLAVYVLTDAVIHRTRAGRVLRATADDGATARLMGVRDRRVFALSMAGVFALIGVAGIFYGIRTPFAPSSGPERLLYAFEAVVIGGLGSIWGTMLGGIALGLSQLIGENISTGFGPLLGHVVFFILLLLKPEGLLKKVIK